MYTYQLQTNTKNASNALSAFAGVLSPSGVVKVDDYTVAFHLDAPNGNFPYLTSSDNYNMIIIPNNYNPASWQSSFMALARSCSARTRRRWGPRSPATSRTGARRRLPSQTQFTFYDTPSASILALTGGTIDVLGQFSVTGGEALLNGGYNVIKLKSSAHRELSMRCDQAPFTDPRVRQAIALTLDRPAIVQVLFRGDADIGNDSPFAPVFPSTNTSVPQRAQNISQAKSLLAAAGHSSGFSTQLVDRELPGDPEYAQIVVQSAKQIGVNIDLKVESSTLTTARPTFGTPTGWTRRSAWSTTAPQRAERVPRPLRFRRSTPRRAPARGTPPTSATPSTTSSVARVHRRRRPVDAASLAGQIETLLLAQTPIIFGYFYNYLTATAMSVSGVYPTRLGTVLHNATKS